MIGWNHLRAVTANCQKSEFYWGATNDCLCHGKALGCAVSAVQI